MKYLIGICVGLLLLVSSSNAQENSITFSTTELTFYGLQADLPDWQGAGPGAYRRGNGAGDFTTIIVQSAPLDRDSLVRTLLPRLGVEELPERAQELTTENFTWDVYIFDVSTQGIDITIHFALAEADGATHIVLLQAAPDEAELLGNDIFFPVLNSVSPLVEEETEDTSDLPYTSEDVTFESGDITLAGTITIPEGDAPFPAIVLLTGSGAQDRNETLILGNDDLYQPFAEIADHLTRNGFVVLRYDDRGFAESEGDILTATLFDFADDASAAVNLLAARDDVNTSKIGLLGHSEGGMIAPLVATNNENVSFIVGMAAPAVTYKDVILEQIAVLLPAEVDDETRATILNLNDEFATAIADGDLDTAREAVRELGLLQTGEELSDEVVEQQIAQQNIPYWQTGYLFNPAEYWVDLDIPALLIFGGKDIQVPASQSIPVFEDLFTGRDDSEIITLDDANHLFQEAETGMPEEYANLDQNLMPEFLEAVSDWLLATIAVE